MIELNVDIRKAKSTKLVDFNEICRESDSVEVFTRECGIELQTALLVAIVAAEDEYARILQTKSKKKMTEKQKIEIGEFLMDFVKDIDEDMIRSFRETVMK